MTAQKELLEGAKVSELREFAAEHEVDLEGARSKADVVDKLAASRKVSKDDVEARFGEDDATTDEAPADTTPADTTPTTPGDTAAGAQTATPPPGVTVAPPVSPRGPEAVVGDPALGDVRDLVAQRAEGRTSDPATRADDKRAADTPTDINVGVHPSDAGPDAYPFPTQGDVDVALLKASTHKGEFQPALNVDDWVILDGSHEDVPDRLDGHMAAVVNAPSIPNPKDGQGDPLHAARVADPDRGITVRTRDEVNATLVLPIEAFKVIGRGGRSAVLPVG